MRTRRQTGFTLIELMIVVAIVAILAAIAIPSFSEQIRKGRRTEAISSMQDAQLRLERWRVDHPSFAGSTIAIPASDHYTFAIAANAATPSEYSITATPQGAQDKDVCGTLSITANGDKVTKSPSDKRCW